MKISKPSFVAAILLTTVAAQAQIGDIMRKVDTNKVVKGAKVAKAVASDFSPEQELEIGKVIAGKLLKNYPLSKNQKLHDYVTLVGLTLVPYSERPKDTWHFAVVDSDKVNAFSTPGNFVFVTTTMLHQVKSEAELATVLGHEIAHVTKKHILGEIKKANVFTAGIDLAMDGRGNGLTQEFGKRVADMAYERLIEKGIDRSLEYESDRVGVAMAAAAGYRENEVITFLTALKALSTSKPGAFAQLAKTHPSPDQRITALQKNAKLDGQGAFLDTRLKQWVAMK